ncbi:DUF3304 domain-containing protein [Xanthomonas translucens]|jgi:hypothetical protein|uniref:DUF3304 domain-containing protein n=2 Tax=Xanthomonas TaxID=338 RepID=UPI000A9221C3|nr:DUF3304 domain-containing protein [Xanthomonas translucens]
MTRFPCRIERLQEVFRALALGGLAALSLGCSADRGQTEDDGMFSSTVEPMDNDPSDTFVRNVYIDGRWAGSAGPGGSGVADGIRLPIKWHPGLTAHVRWERCEPYAKNCQWHELDVPVAKYTEVGMTHLHIMPGDKRVLIIPSMLAPNNSEYPGPGYPSKDFDDIDHSKSNKNSKEGMP